MSEFKENVVTKIAETQVKIGIAFKLIDEAVEALTDEEAEKIVWDALLDKVEDKADKIKRPRFVAKLLQFSAKRFRKRYDIPEYDS